MPQKYSKTPLPSPFKEENHNGLWLLQRNMCLIFILYRWRLYLNSSRLTRKRERSLHTCSVKTTQNHICSKQLISYTRKLQQIARRYCPNPFPVKQHTHSSSGKLFKINKGVKTQSAGAFFLLFLQHFAYFLHKPASAVPSIYKISEEFPQWMKHNMTLMPYNSALVTDLVNNELCIFEPSDCTYFFKALCSERKCLGFNLTGAGWHLLLYSANFPMGVFVPGY